MLIKNVWLEIPYFSGIVSSLYINLWLKITNNTSPEPFFNQTFNLFFQPRIWDVRYMRLLVANKYWLWLGISWGQISNPQKHLPLKGELYPIPHNGVIHPGTQYFQHPSKTSLLMMYQSNYNEVMIFILGKKSILPTALLSFILNLPPPGYCTSFVVLRVHQWDYCTKSCNEFTSDMLCHYDSIYSLKDITILGTMADHCNHPSPLC